MEQNFDQAVKWLWVDETGIEAENDPSRSSNRFGVSLAMLSLWTGDRMYDASFDKKRARGLFLDHIWNPFGCSDLPAGLDYWVFDCGYRFGGVAKNWLALSLKLNPFKAEPRLVAEMIKKQTPRDIILEMDVFVRRRMKSDPAWEECKHWWTNRTNRARDRAIKLSRGEKVK